MKVRNSHRRCSVKKGVLKETLAQVLSGEFSEIFKNTSFFRILPVAAFKAYSEHSQTSKIELFAEIGNGCQLVLIFA